MKVYNIIKSTRICKGSRDQLMTAHKLLSYQGLALSLSWRSMDKLLVLHSQILLEEEISFAILSVRLFIKGQDRFKLAAFYL